MWTNLKTVFGADLRTLALFRIMLGVYVIVDLCNRWPNLTALYTDQGVLSRVEAIAYNHPVRWSLLYISGAPWVIHALFAVLFVAALCLIIGYRTRIATVVCWLLVISVTNRNLMVLQGDDDLSCVLLFWAMFLPLGARFSFDDALRAEHEAPQTGQSARSHAYFSVATIAALLQVSYVYAFGAMLKAGPEWHETYDAVYYALSAEGVSTSLGEMLLGFKGLLGPVTQSVFWLELLMPLYIFSPLFFKVLRPVGLALLVAMHIGFALFLSVGLFPLASIASLTLLVPGLCWDWLEARWNKRRPDGQWALFYDDGCIFCRKVCLILRSFCLPYGTTIMPAQGHAVAGPILEAENSWVVQTPSGELLRKWDALCTVLKQNPVTWIKGAVLAAIPTSLGVRLYDIIGENRLRLGALTGVLLPHRNVSAALSGPVSTLVVVAAVFVFVWNVDQDPDVVLELPDAAEDMAKFLRLNQRWGMFAPSPIKLDGWYGFEGTLQNGAKVDLWTGAPGYPPVRAPEDLRGWNKDYRWRKYFTRLHRKDFTRQRANLARYWCKQSWTDRDGNVQELARAKMTFYGRYTQPDFRPDRYKEFLLYNREC